MNPEFLAAIFSIVNSVVVAAVSYGALKSKIERLEKDLDQTRENTVSIALLDAIINPLKEDLRELKQDVRHIVDALEKK